MFSMEEKKFLSAEIEKLLLGLNHPEMPKTKPEFKLHVDGAESWSWADIEPNHHFENKKPGVNGWNEIARKAMGEV